MLGSPPFLRRLALILALLPGLTLSGGETVRVCLHALIGAEEICIERAASGGSCCAEEAPDAPIARDLAPCEGCCVELAGQDSEPIAPTPSASGQVAATLTLPPAPRAVVCDVLPLERPAAWAPSSAGWPPGRAPTPLRI